MINRDNVHIASQRLGGKIEELLYAINQYETIIVDIRQINSKRISQDIQEWDLIRNKSHHLMMELEQISRNLTTEIDDLLGGDL